MVVARGHFPCTAYWESLWKNVFPELSVLVECRKCIRTSLSLFASWVSVDRLDKLRLFNDRLKKNVVNFVVEYQVCVNVQLFVRCPVCSGKFKPNRKLLLSDTLMLLALSSIESHTSFCCSGILLTVMHDITMFCFCWEQPKICKTSSIYASGTWYNIIL